MINILLDGFSVLENWAWVVFCILLMVMWGQLVINKILVNVFEYQFTDAEYISISFVGWIFPVMGWAGLFFVTTFLFGKIIGIILSAIMIVIPFFFLKIKKISLPANTLILFFLFSLILRLAFLEKAILPSYFDSAEHYRIISYFLDIYKSEILPTSWFVSIYYHAGYHFLSAAFVSLFQLKITDFMLVFGQVIVAVLPISFFFILKQITQSNTAALFTCLLAGFGFHMPAYLVNWGKYPALLSLLGIQFVLWIGYFVATKDLFQKRNVKIYWMFASAILIATLIHTRALIVFTLIFIAYLLTLQQRKLPIRLQYFIFGLVLLFLGIEAYFIQQNTVLALLLSRYLKNDIWILFFVLFLMLFSIKFYPVFTFFLLTSLSFFILTLFFPIHLFSYGVLTPLDRPYVQMLLYLPLSIIAGLGFAGLLQTIQNFPNAKTLLPATIFILLGFVILNTKFNYGFYPSDCCQTVSRDDLSAFTWMDKTLSPDATVLIASSRLYVTSYESPHTQAGADAGIWITPLASRSTILAPMKLSFDTEEGHKEICVQNLDYIYVGNMAQSFNVNQLTSHSNWYRQVFALPNVQIYQIIGCE